MTDQSEQKSHTEGEDYIGGNAVRQMFILALLYLPLGFFLWFFAASLLMYPTQLLTSLALTGLYPDVFSNIVQLDFYFEIQTVVALSLSLIHI